MICDKTIHTAFVKGEKYLLTYNIGNYTEIGTYTGIIHWDDNGIEHRFKVGERSVLVLEEEIKEIKQDLMNELKEGIDALKERRNAERERLDERLGKRDRVDQEETFAPHMDEERVIKKQRVYLVFFDGYDSRQFIDVFFTEDAAKKYISRKSRSNSYEIEVFEETDNGRSKEIY